MIEMAKSLVAGGAAAWYNPAGLFFRGYFNLGSIVANLGDLRRAAELHAQGHRLAERFGDAAWTEYFDAERVYQLPLGTIGVAVGTALLPVLSRQVRAGEAAVAIGTLNRAIEYALSLTLPAARHMVMKVIACTPQSPRRLVRALVQRLGMRQYSSSML